MNLSVHLYNDIREFKRLRRQLQRKRHIKIELYVKLSLLRLFHADRFSQNRRTALSLAWYDWFSCKGKEWKSERFTAASSRCCQNLKFENFTSSFSRLRQNITPKSGPHVQHDYFSSFNLSNHWFVALSLTLPSSNLKPPIREQERRRVSASLVLFGFRPRFRAHLTCYLVENNQFRVLYAAFFSTCFEGQSPCYARNNVIYGWHTWRRSCPNDW